MPRRYAPRTLHALRNDLDINRVIAQLLDWPCKTSDGYFRFLCPRCGEFNTATNPATNLARCFCCHTNFNPIDFVIAADDCSFVDAVQFLEPYLTATANGDTEPRQTDRRHKTTQSGKHRAK